MLTITGGILDERWLGALAERLAALEVEEGLVDNHTPVKTGIEPVKITVHQSLVPCINQAVTEFIKPHRD